MGAYSRTTGVARDRIYNAVEEVGTSVTLTTLTSLLAFGLGCLSSVPAVYWLCLYAIPTIACVYLYQITFFVAAIVLDERRIADNRRDCCTWVTVKTNDNNGGGDDDDDDDDIGYNRDMNAVDELSSENRKANPEENKNDQGVNAVNEGNTLPTEQPASDEKANSSVIEHLITWYAEFLMQPVVKGVVIVAFVALAGLCAWSASRLTQFFDVADVMPKDSYATGFIRALEDHSETFAIDPQVYFRFVDQSLPSVQEQMKSFVDDLVAMEAVPFYPPFFWLNDFETFVQEHNGTAGDLPFNDQLNEFLAMTGYGILYNDSIVRDPITGNILTSRVRMSMGNVDIGNVQNEVDAFKDQSQVTDAQEVNQGKDEYPFFFYDDIFQIWAFYRAVVDELVLTTVLGVATVTGVALLFVPHWTAALFVFPLICMLYVDLLGIMQWGDVHIDPVSLTQSILPAMIPKVTLT